MENHIDQLLTLGNGSKYIILRQGIYNNDNYYMAARSNEEETDILDEFVILHEFEQDGKKMVELVKDASLLQLLLKHLCKG